jgi:Protein of unknown function (DUF1552)
MSVSRRDLLRASAFVPLMSSVARAAPSGFIPPRNLVVLYHPNGLEPGWKPTVVNGVLTFPPVLGALTPFASRLLCVYGLQNGVKSEVMSHPQGMTSLWTGAQIAKDSLYSAWPSFDQLIAEKISMGLPFPSLEFGVQSQVGFGAGGNDSVMIYGREGKRQPEDDPSGAFRRIFSGAVNPAEQASLRARRQSVLDLVKDELARIRPAYGAMEQVKLDAHLAGVRALERRLDDLAGLRCTGAMVPPTQTTSQLEANENFPALVDLQLDVLTLSLSCGVTRVTSLQLSRSSSDRRIPGVNPNTILHAVMHAGTRAEKVAINQYFAGVMARLLSKLAAVQRPDGTTLLDETLVVWGTEMAVGNHLRNPVPFFIAGGHPTQGYFKQGTLLDLPTPQRTTRLLISAMEAMGVTGVSTLGDLTDELSRGPLPGASRVS